MHAAKRVAFGATLAVFAASWIAPRWPVEQALHSSLTVLGLAHWRIGQVVPAGEGERLKIA